MILRAWRALVHWFRYGCGPGTWDAPLSDTRPPYLASDRRIDE